MFHKYLFTLDLENHLEQLTKDDAYMDFDCAWSEDGTQIVFSRLPIQESPWVLHSQIWLMDADGTNLRQITQGGTNPQNEAPHGSYPIGIDADPDLSPDNTHILFSRLRTGQENQPFGVYELIIRELTTGIEHIVDSTYANMIPEWKSQGIVFIRQVVSPTNVMEQKQSIYLYTDDTFLKIEPYSYHVFPIGSNGASWIDIENTDET